MSEANMLEIKDLKVSIEDKEILSGINLSVKAGEVHAIMGPNGSGKSTLASALAGRDYFTITSGKILYEGKDLTELSPEPMDPYVCELRSCPGSPQSKYTVVAAPLGVTVALNRAPVALISVTASVLTVGACDATVTWAAVEHWLLVTASRVTVSTQAPYQ